MAHLRALTSLSRYRHTLRYLLLFAVVGGLARGDVSATVNSDQQRNCFYTIEGTVFLDADKDGVQDIGDNGLPGWTVEFWNLTAGYSAGSVTTASDGTYSYSANPDLMCYDEVRVREIVKSGWQQTFPTGAGEYIFTVANGGQYYNIDFGNFPPCRDTLVVYTDDADFEMGELNGVITNSDQLELDPTGEGAYPYAWIANSQDGTISKVNVRTGKEEARYFTGPPNIGNNFDTTYLSPSRTAIDKDGNCWVLNRAMARGPQFHQAPSLTQILVDDYYDRNANGYMETCQDTDGSGVIDAGEILPWGDDERVIRHYHLYTGQDEIGRPLAIDKDGFIWVGFCKSKMLQQYDPTLPPDQYGPYPQNQPSPVATLHLNCCTWDNCPYGAVLGCNGNLYISSNKDHINEIDPSGPSIVQTVTHSQVARNYGIAVDNHGIVWAASYMSGISGCIRWDPSAGAGGVSYITASDSFWGRGLTVTDDGKIWMATNFPNRVARFSSTATSATYDWISDPYLNQPVGVGVDLDGYIIVVGRDSDAWKKLDPTNGSIVSLPGPQTTGHVPYTYSDFTGNLLNRAAGYQGEWTVTTDGQSVGTLWRRISWNSALPPGTSISVRAQATNGVGQYTGQWLAVANAAVIDPPLTGRYLHTKVKMSYAKEACDEPFVTPVLYDLTVEARCDSCFFFNCQDTTVVCESEAGAVVYFDHPSITSACDTLLGVTCDPPPGTLFQIGPNPVTCTAYNQQQEPVECTFFINVTGDCIPVPTGACCYEGQCQILTESQCRSIPGAVYYGDGTTCNDGCDFDCLRPPRGMLAWWPLDSLTGGATPNMANHLHDGTVVGSPTVLPGEKVVASVSFNGSSDYITASSDATVNLGARNLTIDAWIATDKSSGLAPIMDKRISGASPLQGYSFFVYSGYPGLQLAVGGQYSNYALSAANGGSAAFVADGTWHFVAVTVDRDDPAGIQFYVDGMPTGTPLNPTSRQGNLDNAANLWIGRSYPIASSSSYFDGVIDELEIFGRELSASEIQSIYNPDDEGKCREACYAKMRAICCDEATVNASFTIFNYSEADHLYSWGVTPLSGSGNCSLAALPMWPSSGTLTIPARSCETIAIELECPSGLSWGQRACYQVSVFNHDTSRNFGCTGTVKQRRWWCVKGQVDVGSNTDYILLSPGVPRPVNFIVRNAATDSAVTTFDYEIVPVTSNEDTTSEFVSLNGLSPGMPIMGQIEIALGEEVAIPLTVEYGEHQPLAFDKILVRCDEDGDGEKEAIAEIAVQSVLYSPTGVDSDSRPQSRPRRPFRSVPNPFNPIAEISFELSGKDRAPVTLQIYDLRGREVKTFYTKALLAPGIHTVVWEGNDNDNRKVASGIYILRLETPERIETVKAVLIK